MILEEITNPGHKESSELITESNVSNIVESNDVVLNTGNYDGCTMGSTEDFDSDNENITFESDGLGRYGKYIRKREYDGKFFVLKSIKGEDQTFGYFNSHEEAIKARDELIENNWGLPEDEDVNLVKEGKYGKYISSQYGIYRVSKVIDGKTHYFGQYDDLDDAKYVRDLLIENDWNRKVIPPELYIKNIDKNHYIRSTPRGYVVSKIIDGELKYFGTYSTKEEALDVRNELIINNWEIEEYVEEEEEYDINVYVKNDVYYVKKEVNGEWEVFGTFNDSIEAINFRNICIRKNWDVEKVFNVPLEEDSPKSLKFPVTVGLSSQNNGWVVIRDYIEDFFPIQKCEYGLPMEMEGISIKPHSKFLVRLFYNKNNELSQYLNNKILEDNESLAYVELFLNQENSDLQGTLNFESFDDEKNFLEVSKTFTKSFYERGMFTIPREFSKYFFNILPYESNCHFEVDGIKAKGKLNFLLRCSLEKEDLEYLKSIKNIGDKVTFKIPILK